MAKRKAGLEAAREVGGARISHKQADVAVLAANMSPPPVPPLELPTPPPSHVRLVIVAASSSEEWCTFLSGVAAVVSRPHNGLRLWPLTSHTRIPAPRAAAK